MKLAPTQQFRRKYSLGVSDSCSTAAPPKWYSAAVGMRMRFGEPVEVGERAGNPARALLGEHELESRMALEHAREDQVPERAVRVDRDLDQHHRTRGRVGDVEGREAAAAVVVDHDVELLACRPQRLVDVGPQRRELVVGRHARQQHAAGEAGFLRESHLGQRVVDVVQQDLGDAGPPAGRGRAEVGEPAVVRLQPGPSVLVLGRRSVPASRARPTGRRAGSCWGTAPRRRCRRPRAPRRARRSPSCDRRSIRRGPRRGCCRSAPTRRTRRTSATRGTRGTPGPTPPRDRRPR